MPGSISSWFSMAKLGFPHLGGGEPVTFDHINDVKHDLILCWYRLSVFKTTAVFFLSKYGFSVLSSLLQSAIARRA